MNSGTAAEIGAGDHGHFVDELTADTLSALMRSTWTWDDRALRRDLAVLLVDVAAAHGADGAAAAFAPSASAEMAAVLRDRTLAAAARFVGTVLGAKLIADTGSPLRSRFVGPATDVALFERRATAGLAAVAKGAARYLRAAVTVPHPEEATWRQLAADQGATGLAAAMRASGHALGTAPVLGNLALAWQALVAVGTDGDAYAERLLRGQIRTTLAAAEQSGSWDPSLVRTRAVPGTNGWTLTGTKLFVPDAVDLDVVFTIARSVAGPSLFAVDASAVGLTVTDLPVVDSTRPLAQIQFDSSPAVLLGREGGGGDLMVKAIDLAMTALAGEQVGIAERAAEVLLEHLPNATEAVAPRRLAEAALDHVVATSLWRQALDGDADVGAAARAHLGCSAASVRLATLAAEVAPNDQDAGPLVRRALSASLLLGGPAVSHERLLERLGI